MTYLEIGEITPHQFEGNTFMFHSPGIFGAVQSECIDDQTGGIDPQYEEAK